MTITHRPLGRTGCKVSPLCLGTMNFGPQTSEADSFAIMDKALELGIQFWDTADVYGWKRGIGVTESILGRYFAARPGAREKVVLATEGGAGDEGVRGHGRRGQAGPEPQPGAVGAEDHRVLRGVAEADADDVDRPVPDAPHRPVGAGGGVAAGV